MKNPILLPSNWEHTGCAFVHSLNFTDYSITNGTFLDEMYRLQCQNSHTYYIQRSFAANYMVTSRQNTNKIQTE